MSLNVEQILFRIFYIAEPNRNIENAVQILSSFNSFKHHVNDFLGNFANYFKAREHTSL